MKEKLKGLLDKFNESKYASNIMIVVIAIILIIAGYLIYQQYSEGKKNPMNPEIDVYNEADIYSNNNSNENNEGIVSDKDKTSFKQSLKVITKGKSVGHAVMKDIDTSNLFSSIHNSLKDVEKLNITTDTVVSVDISSLDTETKGKINDVSGVIFNKDGKVLFDRKIIIAYDRITLAVDELEESEEYYAIVNIYLNDGTYRSYLFKF